MSAKAPAVADRSARILDEGAEMLTRHLDGDPRAFGELMERFGGGVYAYLQRSGVQSASADDLFQETFLRVHRSAGRYDDHYPFKTWLFAIASNLVRSHFRKQKVRRVLVSWWRRTAREPDEPETGFDPGDRAASPEDRVADRQQLLVIEQALGQLADGPRRALLLTRVEGLSLEAAARALEVPVATVKTWVRRGRLQLADALEQAAAGPESRPGPGSGGQGVPS